MSRMPSARRVPRPDLYVAIFLAWGAALLWFHPRLDNLLASGDTPAQRAALLFFIAFTELAWLYGFYNIGVVAFAWWYRRRAARQDAVAPALAAEAPPVAVLYTTCNDFVEESAASCVSQQYPAFTVYLLDDSSEPAMRARVDAFAARHPERVRVVRRGTRRGFKAGNLNHALAHVAAAEPVFALVDADEVLPPDFLSRTVPRLLADERCGFVQATHRCLPGAPASLGEAMGVGVDIHWRWYQPLRNRFGFVMLLGHGAVIRRQAWAEASGFPEIVSEDLGFALRIRACGWRGHFAEDVVCWEAFPEDVRAFRVRHMKWTRGTCEFLAREMGWAIRNPRISLVEKLDILFPTLSLPLSLFYFLYIVDANVVMATLFGHPHPLTIALGTHHFVLPTWGLDPRFREVMSADFFLITMATFLAPVLCFIIELARTPRAMFRFLCRSSAVYAALGPMSCLGVVAFLLTGTARFLVTGERGHGGESSRAPRAPLRTRVRQFLVRSHPDHPAVQGFEVACGLVFGATCLALVQISFLGLALAFILLPVLHHVAWEHPFVRWAVYVPFLLILAGMSLGALSVVGVQAVFFGYGFHF